MTELIEKNDNTEYLRSGRERTHALSPSNASGLRSSASIVALLRERLPEPAIIFSREATLWDLERSGVKDGADIFEWLWRPMLIRFDGEIPSNIVQTLYEQTKALLDNSGRRGRQNGLPAFVMDAHNVKAAVEIERRLRDARVTR